MLRTIPLQNIPDAEGPLPPDIAISGQNIPPIERLRIMSPEEWENFVLEWAHSLKDAYREVERCAGAGDQGRDIVAFATSDLSIWDNYQCKRSKDRLVPSDIWVELGKLCYYTFIKEYTPPRNYYFIASQGAGNKLSKLLRNPEQIREGLIQEWDNHCRRGITSTQEIPLEGEFLAYVKAFNFSNIHAPSPLTIVDQHRRTAWHTARFGGGLPARPNPPAPPETIEDHEANYIRALLDAYEDRLKIELLTPDHLGDEVLSAHLLRCRREFYSAEALRGFSRDNVPQGTFEHLLNEVYDGVMDVVEAQHADAVERILATVKQAKGLQLSANVLVSRVLIADRGGICHQLANDLRIRWRL